MGMGDRRCTHWDEDCCCEFKTSLGCSIYKNRPFACRLFGAGKYYTPMGCQIRKKTGMPDNGISAEKQGELMFEYFQILHEQGVEETHLNTLFALHEHDVRNGFRTDEDLASYTHVDPDIMVKLAEWREKEKHGDTTDTKD